jgi:teichoic acid glycerol-phosphate primase
MSNSFKKIAGLVYGPAQHHLDHLVPICYILGIPLIVTEESFVPLCRKYYPMAEVLYIDYLNIANFLAQNYDIVFYSIPRDTFDEIFFFAQKLLNKRLLTIWCPHGNSDKGNNSYFMEALYKEEVALVYGKKMSDFLIQKGVFEQLKANIEVGNYRYTFYQEHKEFYHQILGQEITHNLPQSKKTILFAPTWLDSEKSTSFFQACPSLIEQLPEDYNLIVKLHPNLKSQANDKVDEILEKYTGNANVLFLTEFPPIYPLLDLVSIYIGDMSSIGYDFLIFEKPMFFLNQNCRDAKKDPGLYLYRCGVEIRPENYCQIYNIIKKHLPSDKIDFSYIRKQTYQYTFANEKSKKDLRQEILNTCISIDEQNLTFL